MLLRLNSEYAPESVSELEALLSANQVISRYFENSSRALQDHVPMAARGVASLRAYRHRNRLGVNSGFEDDCRVCNPRFMHPVVPEESKAMLARMARRLKHSVAHSRTFCDG